MIYSIFIYGQNFVVKTAMCVYNMNSALYCSAVSMQIIWKAIRRTIRFSNIQYAIFKITLSVALLYLKKVRKLDLFNDIGTIVTQGINIYKLSILKAFKLSIINTSPPKNSGEMHHCVYPHCNCSKASFYSTWGSHCNMSVRENLHEFYVCANNLQSRALPQEKHMTAR